MKILLCLNCLKLQIQKTMYVKGSTVTNIYLPIFQILVFLCNKEATINEARGPADLQLVHF